MPAHHQGVTFMRRNRQPVGTPAGGQFAASSHSETGTTLAPVSTPTWWLPLDTAVAAAIGGLSSNVAPDDVTFPASEHAVALDALSNLAGSLLERHGMPRAPLRSNDELFEMRTVVAEEVAAGSWPEARRDLIMSALGDVSLAKKADRLARLTPGSYRFMAVHYLVALERDRLERESA